MTAAAIMHFADRVTICTDSRVYDDLGESVGYAGKTYPLPHLRACYFGRGKLSVTVSIVTKLLLSPNIHSFDAAADAIAGISNEVLDQWCTATGFDRTGQRLHEGLLAGWSESQQKMRLVFNASIENYEPNFRDTCGGPIIAWPLIPASYVAPAKSTDTADDRLRSVLLGIDRWCAENAEAVDNHRLGGPIVLTDLTEAGISYRTIGSFEDAPAKPDSKRVAERKAQRNARKGRR